MIISYRGKLFIYLATVFKSGLWSEVKDFYVDTNFLNTGGLSAPADRIYLPLYTHRPLRASRPQTLKHTDTNEHKHSRTANPLVHIRYTIFSSCFSSAFPNGWLNQLCGAWFKSSGMLGYCQRLVRQQGGNKVTGGEQQLTSFSSFTEICFYQDESQIKRADRVQKYFCLFKELTSCHQSHIHMIYSG